MPKRFPPEFKADVVRVARRGDLSIAGVAADFDISVESVKRWKRQADIDEGIKDGLTSPEQAQVAQLRRANRRLEQENEILRRAAAYFASRTPSQNEVPAGPRAGRRGVPGAPDLRGTGLFHPGLLQVGG